MRCAFEMAVDVQLTYNNQSGILLWSNRFCSSSREGYGRNSIQKHTWLNFEDTINIKSITVNNNTSTYIKKDNVDFWTQLWSIGACTLSTSYSDKRIQEKIMNELQLNINKPRLRTNKSILVKSSNIYILTFIILLLM